MRVCFDTSKKFVLFIADNGKEYVGLDAFPGFIKPMIHHACHAILPVCYNIITRLQAKRRFPNIRIDQDVQAWLDSPFTLAPLPEGFKFHTPAMKFQEIALRYIYTLGSAGLLLAPGMGKSKVVLDYIWLAQFSKSLIVCPKPLLFVWEDEIAKHRPELSDYYVVKTTNWEEEAEGVMNAKVVIINYNKAVDFKHRLKECGFQFMHLDEFLIKDPKTTRTKALTEIGKAIPFKAGGSGTLINNSPLDVFCPTRFLQPSLVGGNYMNFFNEYAITVPMKDSQGNRTDKRRVVNFRGLGEIRAILESCCIVMNKEEWLQLPEKKFIDLTCQMSQEQKRVYYELVKNYVSEIDGQTIEVDNALVMMSKLYQISNGFLYLYEEAEKDVVVDLLATESKSKAKRKKSDRKTIFFQEQPKIQLLKEVLTEKIPKRKAIIWFNMEAELTLIEQLLTQEGLSYLVIKGGESKTGEKVREFNNNPAITYLICQAKSVNYGITVMGRKSKDLEEEGVEVLPDVDTQVYTQIFYSFNFSLEVYLQQQDRIHRLGQDKVCEYYRLFSNSPIDWRIKQILIDKMTLREEMLIDVANSLLKNEEQTEEIS